MLFFTQFLLILEVNIYPNLEEATQALKPILINTPHRRGSNLFSWFAGHSDLYSDRLFDLFGDEIIKSAFGIVLGLKILQPGELRKLEKYSRE